MEYEVKQLLEDNKRELREIKELVIGIHKEVLNVNDLSLITGLSKSHIYKLVWSKRIPYYKNEGGKLTFFKKEEINEWLCHYRVKTKEEIEQEAIAYCEKNKRRRKGA